MVNLAQLVASLSALVSNIVIKVTQEAALGPVKTNAFRKQTINCDLNDSAVVKLYNIATRDEATKFCSLVGMITLEGDIFTHTIF